MHSVHVAGIDQACSCGKLRNDAFGARIFAGINAVMFTYRLSPVSSVLREGNS